MITDRSLHTVDCVFVCICQLSTDFAEQQSTDHEHIRRWRPGCRRNARFPAKFPTRRLSPSATTKIWRLVCRLLWSIRKQLSLSIPIVCNFCDNVLGLLDKTECWIIHEYYVSIHVHSIKTNSNKYNAEIYPLYMTHQIIYIMKNIS